MRRPVVGLVLGTMGLCLVACGGSATNTLEGSDPKGDGGSTSAGDGDGDGDIGGDGDMPAGTGGETIGIGCDLSLVYGLNVTVVGGATVPPTMEPPSPAPIPPAPIPPVPIPDGDGIAVVECHATVVAKDGDYSETLDCYGDLSGDCYCYGAGERPGNYEVTATWGSEGETQVVSVRKMDECHVTTEYLTFFDDMTGEP